MIRLTVPTAAVLLAVVFIAGCFNNTVPSEVFLRLDMTNEEACPPESEDKGAALVALKDLTALSGLNRQAVIVSEGNVMHPSMVWYWEGVPADLVTKALLYTLTCSKGLNLVSPYSPRLEHEAVLTGQLDSFEVVRSGRSADFSVQIRLNLWGKNANVLMSSATFAASAPIKTMDGEAIAEAAAKALWQVIRMADPWLKGELRAGGLGN